MVHSGTIVGFVLVALSGILWFALIPLGVDAPGSIENVYQQPDFWIRVITVLMLITGLMILVQSRRSVNIGETDVIPPIKTDAIGPRFLRISGGLLIFFLFYFLVERLGIIVTSTLAILASSFLYREYRFYLTVPLAVIVPVALYFFFLKVASIPTPAGILEGFGPF